LVLAGDAGACRDVRLPGRDILEERVAWDSDWQCLHAFAKTDFILKDSPWKGRKLYDLYKATEPPREWFPELLLHARKIGITIFSFVFSPEDVDFLEQFNPPAYKIASADRAFALSSKSRRAKCIT